MSKNNWNSIIKFNTLLVISMISLVNISGVVSATEMTNSQFRLSGGLIPATGASSGSSGSGSFNLSGDTVPFVSPHVTTTGTIIINNQVPGNSGGSSGGGSASFFGKLIDILKKPIGGMTGNDELNNSLNILGSSGEFDKNGIPQINYSKMLCKIRYKRSDFGSIGPYVAFIQKIMIDYKLNTGKVDGKYKTLTKRAVRVFQQKFKKIYPEYITDNKSMYVDGIWGIQTHAFVQALHCNNFLNYNKNDVKSYPFKRANIVK